MRSARVIDTIMMFVNEYPGHSCINEIAVFSKSAPDESLITRNAGRPIQPWPLRCDRRDPTVATGPITRAYRANRLIHGKAANTLRTQCPESVRPRIRRAFV